MPVLAVGSIPKHSRVLTKRADAVVQKPESAKVINSFELQAGFLPPKKVAGQKNDPVKVQHFIDSII